MIAVQSYSLRESLTAPKDLKFYKKVQFVPKYLKSLLKTNVQGMYVFKMHVILKIFIQLISKLTAITEIRLSH